MNSSMSDLRHIQLAFAAQLDARQVTDAAQEIFRGERERVKRRLAIYRGNMFANQSKALRGAYPVIAKIVGDEFFEALAREYGRHAPSVSGDLNEFGESIAAFLQNFPHVSELPYLPDVARLEWLVHRAFYAADREQLDAARLAQAPLAAQCRLHLRLHDACGILHSDFPLAKIWEIHQEDYQGDFDLGADTRGGWVLVSRPRFRVQVSSLDAADAAFLVAAHDGYELERALATAQQVNPEFDLGGRLASLFAANVIVDFSY